MLSANSKWLQPFRCRKRPVRQRARERDDFDAVVSTELDSRLALDPGENKHRLHCAAEKCNEGELTAKERAEYGAYVKAGDLISILQSKARRFLKRRKF